MMYKGYEGIAEFDEDAHIFSGEVLGLKDVITFQGESVSELIRTFTDVWLLQQRRKRCP